MDEQQSSDYHNFSQTQSPAHRLPTLNGAEALINAIEKQKPISTGLSNLDAALFRTEALSSDGGIQRGCVTEIYGPPGCGKTHLAIQITANALSENESSKVTWIDTSTQLSYSRLEQFLNASRKGQNDATTVSTTQDADSTWYDGRFRQLYIDSFPHLLAFILHPPDEVLSKETNLLIIDDFSDVVAAGLPQSDKTAGGGNSNSLSRDDVLARSVLNRRAAMLGATSSVLARLAASANLAIVVVSKASTNRRFDQNSAVLKSMLNNQQWNDNVSNRIVIYRDFWPSIDWNVLNTNEAKRLKRRQMWPLRIAEVEKANGRNINADGVRFVILKDRLHQIEHPQNTLTGNIVPPSSPPGHEEDAEEAIDSLELRDVEEVEDQSVTVPEDIIETPYTLPQAMPTAKRKIDEIADSEDEDDLEPETSTTRPLAMRSSHGGFLPSSQLMQEDLGNTSKAHGSKQVDNERMIAEAGSESEHDGEMLLRH